MSFCKSVLLSLGIIINICAYAQPASLLQEDTTAVPSQSISLKFLDKVSFKADQVGQKLDKQTAKALRKYQLLEERLKKKIAGKDSLKAALLFDDPQSKYRQLDQKLQQSPSLQEYIPGLDSMSSAIKFLQRNPQLLSKAKQSSQKMKDAVSKVNELEGRFQKAEEVKLFLKERNDRLTKELQGLGFTKELKKLNKEYFYYGQWLREYKSILKDYCKAERKALDILKKSKWFQEFMQKHSCLSQLFSMPGNYSSPQSLTGLQTRAQVQQLVAQQIGTAPVNGVDPRQYVQGQMQQAQQQLNQLKEKIKLLDTDGGNGDMEMPDFRVNKLRTRPFFKRLEYGFDLQNQRSTNLLPLTSDFSFTIGYKIRNGIQAGIGSGYKMGWGSGIRHLKLTNQGVSLRSYVEAKLKGSIWISSGFEYNYMKEFKKLRAIANPDIWQKSALLGISKKYRIAKNKQGNIQLLYDLLARYQLPRGQALKFRIGYRF